METISHVQRGQHPMLSREKHVGQSAVALMEKEGALFEVEYPSASWKSGAFGVTNVPEITEGVNKGTSVAKWVIRKDTNEALGLHSGTFPEQGSYRFLGEFADRLFPNAATSVTLFGKGERIALTQDLGESVDLGGGDVIKPQIIWVSSFNGQWATAAYDLMTRFFCANQIVGQDPLFKTKHTKFHDITLSLRIHLVEESIERAKTFTRMARVMKDYDYTKEQFQRLVEQLAPMPPKGEDGEVNTRAENTCAKKRTVFYDAWNKEISTWGTTGVTPEGMEYEKGDRWLAYNAIQGAEQHLINTNFSQQTAGAERSLTKAINGRTPLGDKAWRILQPVN